MPLSTPSGTAPLNQPFQGWIRALWNYINTDLNPATLIDVTVPTSGANTTDLVLTSGSYTPTLTNTTNVASSTAFDSSYLRVGNAVTVSALIIIDPTAAAATVLRISLPIASNLGGQANCCGVGTCQNINSQTAVILGNAASDVAEMQFTAADTASRTWFVHFTYKIV